MENKEKSFALLPEAQQFINKVQPDVQAMGKPAALMVLAAVNNGKDTDNMVALMGNQEELVKALALFFSRSETKGIAHRAFILAQLTDTAFNGEEKK